MTNEASLPRTEGFLQGEGLSVLKPGKSWANQDGWSLHYYMFKGLTFWTGKSDPNFRVLTYVFSLLTDLSPMEESNSFIFQGHFLRIIQFNALTI